MKSTVDILQYIMGLVLECARTTLGVFPRSTPRLCHKFWAAMRDMSVLRKVPVGHLHARVECSRDDDCRILGVVMCVGANASRVDDLHLGLGLRPYPDVPVSPAVVAQYLRKEQDRWFLENTMVADVLSIPSPGEQICRTARYSAVAMAYQVLRHGPRGGQISVSAARDMKAQWLGQIGHEPQGLTMGEGRLMWASASGQPTTDSAVVFSIKAEELLEAMECIAWLRDTSHIPFPQ
ncbi:hypothetical protein PENSPDRAFT_395853 [Peniophora sp. CONT]|nr:hypothetical protein PENSPDRAFT_395853 [Peniophora sp. CONT]